MTHLIDSNYFDAYVLFIRRFLVGYIIFYTVITLFIDILFSNMNLADNHKIRYSLFHFILDLLFILPLILTSISVYLNIVKLDFNTLIIYTVVFMLSILRIIYLLLIHLNYSVYLTDNKIYYKGIFNNKKEVDINTINKIYKGLFYYLIIYNSKESIIIFKKINSNNEWISRLKEITIQKNPFLKVS